MNTGSIGPNLSMSPTSDSADGLFEVVLLAGDERAKLLNHISAKIENRAGDAAFTTIRGRQIRMSYNNDFGHVDDQLDTMKPGNEMAVYLKPG